MRTTMPEPSRLLAVVGAASMLLSLPAWSAEDKGPGEAGGEANAAEVESGEIVTIDKTSPPGAPADAVAVGLPPGAGGMGPTGTWIEKLQAHMNKMEALALRYQKSLDAVERQKLWAEHQKEMWAGMQLMQEQAGVIMQTCTNSPVLVKTAAGSPRRLGTTPEARMERLERRFEAMQTTLDRLIDMQLGNEGMPARPDE